MSAISVCPLTGEQAKGWLPIDGCSSTRSWDESGNSGRPRKGQETKTSPGKKKKKKKAISFASGARPASRVRLPSFARFRPIFQRSGQKSTQLGQPRQAMLEDRTAGRCGRPDKARGGAKQAGAASPPVWSQAFDGKSEDAFFWSRPRSAVYSVGKVQHCGGALFINWYVCACRSLQ
ncbi:hypothetical protein MAPG_05756 [Magnaporthiopsis poae ATCC 64411]|uniref:Uncharacterized protein n=1 Tax=Magnaporthiopsis poae (strain ATCC 64411 / 73-15) TaxID=644358 RepID=A0A0C4E090_MAGP6|nr:hypothetical protein MAPG_05756 [Magnaporthiopsis poae ATCC 64411]